MSCKYTWTVLLDVYFFLVFLLIFSFVWKNYWQLQSEPSSQPVLSLPISVDPASLVRPNEPLLAVRADFMVVCLVYLFLLFVYPFGGCLCWKVRFLSVFSSQFFGEQECRRSPAAGAHPSRAVPRR